MPAQIHDKLLRVGKRGTKTTLANPGKPLGATSLTIDNPNNWETRTALIFSLYRETTDGREEEGSYTVWKGVLNNSEITGLELMQGTDQAYEPGGKTVAVMHISSSWVDELMDALDITFNTDGTIKDKAVSLKSIHGGSTAGILQTDSSGVVTSSKVSSDYLNIEERKLKLPLTDGFSIDLIRRGDLVTVRMSCTTNVNDKDDNSFSIKLPEGWRPVESVNMAYSLLNNRALSGHGLMRFLPDGTIRNACSRTGIDERHGSAFWFTNDPMPKKD